MNALITSIAKQRTEDLHKHAERRRRARRVRARRAAPAFAQELSLRRLGAADDEALERLAERDSAETPRGDVLGAELEGHLIAAVSLDSGELVADPFTRTEPARSLLELRVKQLGVRRPRRGYRLAVPKTGSPATNVASASGTPGR